MLTPHLPSPGTARQEAGANISAANPLLEKDLPIFSGQIALFSPFEILQITHQLRKYGNLQLLRDDGLTAECRVGEGGILEAQCGHRHGREAVLTFIWWRKGKFKFIGGPDGIADCTPIKIPELMMDAVLMADEVERRSQYLPAPHSHLSLKNNTAPEDKWGCGVKDVFEYIRTHSGVTAAEMEGILPLAPTQVRLSLALMSQSGILEIAPGNGITPKVEDSVSALTNWNNLNLTVKEENIPPNLTWWYNLIKRFPGGLRLLVAAMPEEGTELIWEVVERLAKMLEVPAPNVMCSSSGPSFVRLRAPCGGVLSLTVLPLVKKNRYLFESFVRSMQACFICSDERIAVEAHAWKSLIPTHLPKCSYGNRTALYEALSEQMKQMSTL